MVVSRESQTKFHSLRKNKIVTAWLDIFLPVSEASVAMVGMFLREEGFQNVHVYTAKPADPLVVGDRH